MTEMADVTTGLSDLELIAAVRAGDLTAYGQLFARHRQAAERMARQLGARSDADDLVAEGFSRVLSALQSGSGPDEFFRAYLLTSIRRLHIDRARAAARVRTTDDEAELDRAVDFVDPAEMRFEQGTAAAAFASLPERWRLVLWHLDVEGQKPADIAPLLGMSPNSVSALAYRAREGLRVAYLDAHLAPSVDETCRWTTSRLAQHVRATLSTRESAKVDGHLDTCARCKALFLELGEVNRDLAGLLAPAILGTAATGYLASSGSIASTGFLAEAAHMVGRPLRSLGAAGPVGVAAAVAVTVVVAAASAFAATQMMGDTRSGTSSSTAQSNPRGLAAASPVAPREPRVENEDAGPETTVVPLIPSVPPLLTPAPPVLTPDTRPSKDAPDAVPSKRPEPTPKPTRPSPSTSPTPPTPSTPPTTPAPGPTNTDYAASIQFSVEPENLLRQVSVDIEATNDPPRGNELTATFELDALSGPVTFRGNPITHWTCNSPGDGEPVTSFTCSRTQDGDVVPPIEFFLQGSNPGVKITISASNNERPPAVFQERACNWASPTVCPAY